MAETKTTPETLAQVKERRQAEMIELHNKIVAQISAFTAALTKGDYKGMEEAENNIKEAEKSYKKVKEADVFADMKATKNPILSGIKTYSFSILAHKIDRDEGQVVGIELIEDRQQQIDLIRLAEFCNIPHPWEHTISKFQQLLTLKAAQELKLTKAEIQKINTSFYMSKLARAVELGETPTSNTQSLKMLNTIIDEVLFIDNGKGKNKLKGATHDIAYLTALLTKKGKAKLSVAIQNKRTFNNIIWDILHRIVTNSRYTLEYKEGEAGNSVEVKTEADATQVFETENVTEEVAAPEAEQTTEVEKKN